MKIKKGDKVLIISGKDRAKTGKVLDAKPNENKIRVEGVNLIKKHSKPKREGEKGQVVETPAFFHVSNVKIICPKCGKGTRITFEITKEKEGKKSKVRICKKCGQVM
ncbi:MAG TPA: 50S ribosomal protein L24 [Candidatus Pacearchaeota archaeon]|nr:50S ribosomal protein L24 [Candidatus Pacearchaeota archaeon]HOU45823.1 50S ribosomal protein L24 [Candidatus Pacearchaeota archaeon]HQI74388.1 50S ribosomal protein L24 [Candidatus Pacearchaeota archaeon]